MSVPDNVNVSPGVTGTPVTVRGYSDGTKVSMAGVPEYLTGGSADAWTKQPVDLTHGLPVQVIGTPATPANVALDGSDITSPSPAMPAGGVGIRGWLSAIWTKLNGSIGVTGTFWQATQPVSGTIAVSNLPGTQPVSGTVAVSNFPATQPISGNVGVSGSVTVSNTAFTANAGTNLNTSLLALETGGNLATIAGKDFATQATLAALNTKIPASPAQDGTDISSPSPMPSGGVGIRGWLSAIYTALKGTLTVSGSFSATTIAPLFPAAANFARPANTTPYTAGLVIAHLTTGNNNYLTLVGVVNNNAGTGTLTRLFIDVSTANSPRLQATLWFYTAVPTANVNDNAAWSPNSTDQGNEAFPPVTLSVFTPAAANGVLDSGPLDLTFKCGASVKDLYVVMTMSGQSYTPSSAETYTLRGVSRPDA